MQTMTSWIRKSGVSGRGTKLFFICLSLFLVILEGNAQQRKNRPNIQGPQGLQINSFTGTIYFERQDFFIKGNGGQGMDFTFAYSSAKYKTNYGYGNGWVFSYGMMYSVDTNNVTSVMFMDGASRKFTPNGSNYDPFPGIYDTWEEYEPDHYRMTSTDGTKYFFDDPLHQRLTGIMDRCGNEIMLQYTDSLVTSVSDLTGRTVNLNWSNGLLTSLSHNIVTPGRSYQYTYDDNGNLLSVTTPKGCEITYQYTDFNKLTAIIDENQSPLYIFYAPSGAARNIVSCVSSMSISYNRALATTFTVEEVGGKRVATEYQYDDEGKLLSKQGNCCGYDVSYGYDENDNIISREDGGGNMTTYTYDENGNITSETDAFGNTITSVYDPILSNVLQETDKRGFTTYYAYDAEGNLLQRTQPLGVVNNFTYDGHGNLLTYTDGRMNTITMTYDPYGNPLTITDPEGGVTTFTYDALGNKLSMTDAEDNVFTYTYDAMDQLLTVTDPYLNQTIHTYDCRSNRITTTDANEHVTMYEYDGLDRQIRMITPEGHTYEYSHDALGNLEKLINANGHASTFEYNIRGQVVRETDALGYSMYSDYNESGNKISQTDKNGNTWTYTYDVLNRLLSTTDPLGGTTTNTYDPNGNITQVTNALGNSVRLEYDALNRLKKETDPLNFEIVYTYDANGNMLTKKDRNNHTWSYTYDKNNRVKTETDPAGKTFVRTYDLNGNLLSVKNRENQTTSYTYDALNRKLTETNPQGEVITMMYDDVGNTTSITMPNGRIVVYTYDADDRVLTEADNIGTYITYTYDANGNVLTQTDGNNHTRTFVYDEMDRATQITDALGNSVFYGYDGNSNLTALTDKNGNITTHTYDALNRNIRINNANGDVTIYTFDAIGNQTSITDAEGRLTTFDYTPLNQVEEEFMPDGSSRKYLYDGNNNIVTRQDYNGTSINYVYNSLNRLIERDYPSGPSATYTYDADGKMLTAVNAHASLSFTYDDANRILTETMNGKTTTYAYDIPGRSRTMTYPGGAVVEEEYDFRDRIMHIDVNGSEVASYAFNAANLMTTKTYGNGTTTNYVYDVADQLTSIEVTPGGLVHFAYTYDPEGNRKTSETLHAPARSEEFSYDPLNRLQSVLTGMLVGGHVQAPSGTSSYQYDALGNRTSSVVNSSMTTYTTNNLNQYTAITQGSTINPEYANGDMTDDGLHEYAYDAEHRIVSVDGGSTATYKYDALGRRVEKNVAGTITRFFYNDRQVIEERNGSDVVIATHVTSPSVDDHIVVFKNSTAYYFHHNALGSVVAMSDAAGTVVERYEYDAYGKPRFYDASFGTLSASTIGIHYLFTGREYDPETGLYFFQARHYHPVYGRFMQRDPAGLDEGINLYQYVNSNPIGWIDPDGMKCVRDAIRRDVQLPGFVSGITKRLGLKQVKMKVHGEVRRCEQCCETTKTKGTTVTIAVGIIVIAEFGSPEFDFWILKIKIGWYGRISVSGTLNGGKDACGNYFGGGCLGLGGELGLIGEVIAGFGQSGVGGGARGGINASGTVCMTCNAGGCRVVANACVAGRVRVWGKVNLPFIGKMEYFREWEIFRSCINDLPVTEVGA